MSRAMGELPRIADLTNAIAELDWIAESALALLETVSQNILALEGLHGLPAPNLGPVDGLNWTMGHLRAKAHDAHVLAGALEEMGAAPQS